MSVTHRDDDLHKSALERLLHPRSVAIVGASGTSTRLGGLVVKLLARHRFPGGVYPVNPKYEEVEGFTCYPSLLEIPADVNIDVAIVFIGADKVVDCVRQCADRGVRSLIILSSGFSEIGPEGENLQLQLTEIANRHHMAVAGPNCAGLANFPDHFVAYGTTNFIDRMSVLDGSIAVLTASGGMGNTIFTFCEERGVGVSFLIGLGNEAVTTAGDYLEALVEEVGVDVVLCNIEAIRDPKRFFHATDRAATLGKPVVVLKGGRSEVGKKAIVTHTAALGGSSDAYASAFKQHGVIQVTDLDELADCGMLFSSGVTISGPRLGIFSLPGGATSLLSDLASDYGFTIPGISDDTKAVLEEILPPIAVVSNPLDPTAGFARDSEKFRNALTTFASDNEFDFVVFFPIASQTDYAQQIANDVVTVHNSCGKPIIAIWTAGRELEDGAWKTLREAGVPLFLNSRSAFRALAHARRYGEWTSRRRTSTTNDYGSRWGQSAESLTSGNADAVRNELRRFDVSFPYTQIVRSEDDVAEAMAIVSGPVAMKILSSDIPHKTEAGGVILDVLTADDALTAYREIIASGRRYSPTAVIDGVEIQNMVEKGVEVIIGISTDDQLGPILSVGLGGVLTEVLHDYSQRPLPVSRADAQDMLSELRGSELFKNFRGRPGADTNALIETMLGVAAFAHAYRDRKPELDLNPVIVLPVGRGAVAVDSLLHFGDEK